MSNINIRSLAKELNLSIGTVSKALKDSHEISLATKQRVLTIAKKFHYNPNPYASSLRRKKSNTIAVVIPEVADNFFSLAIKGIEEVAEAKGFHVLIYLTYESFHKEHKILAQFNNGRVDGILMSVSSETASTSHIEEFDLNKTPIVFFDRVIDGLEIAKITTNDAESSFNATNHLIDCGCKNIFYLSISRHLGINNKRIKGFKKALFERKLKFRESNIINCSHEEEHNYNLFTELFKKVNKPDGIVAGVEKLITPLYSTCKDVGIQIPTELKIISFSNLPNAHFLNPSLTTITQPAFEMGKAAAKLLFKAIDKEGYCIKNEIAVLPSILTVRDSSRI